MQIDLIFIYIKFRKWARTNPQFVAKRRGTGGAKVHIWGGVLGNEIYGPFAFKGPINADSYLDMISNQLIPQLKANNHDPSRIIFVHDNAPAHIASTVTSFLRGNFRAFIGSGELAWLKWPPRSPDLNVMDYFIWAFIKNYVYKNLPDDFGQKSLRFTKYALFLKARCAFNCLRNQPNKLQNATNGIYKRLFKCIGNEGGIF